MKSDVLKMVGATFNQKTNPSADEIAEHERRVNRLLENDDIDSNEILPDGEANKRNRKPIVPLMHDPNPLYNEQITSRVQLAVKIYSKKYKKRKDVKERIAARSKAQKLLKYGPAKVIQTVAPTVEIFQSHETVVIRNPFFVFFSFIPTSVYNK